MDTPVWIFSALDCNADKETDSTERALHAWNDLQSIVCGLAWVGANQCQGLFEWTKNIACSYHVRPISLIITSYLIILVLCTVAWTVLGRMLRCAASLAFLGFQTTSPLSLQACRYYAAKRGSGFVPCSLTAIKEWRSAHASLFPPVSHCWTKAKENSAPVVCCVCTNPVTGSQWQVKLWRVLQWCMGLSTAAVMEFHKIKQWCTSCMVGRCRIPVIHSLHGFIGIRLYWLYCTKFEILSNFR
jgi:hypothetical protein